MRYIHEEKRKFIMAALWEKLSREYFARKKHGGVENRPRGLDDTRLIRKPSLYRSPPSANSSRIADESRANSSRMESSQDDRSWKTGKGLVIPLKMSAHSFHLKVSSVIESEEERQRLFEAIRDYHETGKIKAFVRKLRSILHDETSTPLFKDIRGLIRNEHEDIYDQMLDRYLKGERLVTLRKERDKTLGFAFTGGKEFGIGFFVTDVTKDSIAFTSGLKVGDEMRRVNNFPLQETIHDELLTLLKNKSTLILLVKFIGHIPVKRNNEIIWKDVNNNKLNGHTETLEESFPNERIVSFRIGTQGLGCNIRTNISGQKGVFVTSVVQDSLASRLDIEIGDQVLSVNGRDFTSIEHKEALKFFQSTHELTMVLSHNKIVASLLNERRTKSRATHRGSVSISEKIYEYQPPEIPKDKPTNNTTHLPKDKPTNNTHKHKPTKKASISENLNEVVEVERFEKEKENQNEVVIPDKSNFDYSEEFLKGREVHYVSIPKGEPISVKLEKKEGVVAVKYVHPDGAVGKHGFIQPGDWLLNVEGDDLIGRTPKQARDIIFATLKRWSKHIEFIVACPPGRTPPTLPNKQETQQLVKDSSLLYPTPSSPATSSLSSLDVSSYAEAQIKRLTNRKKSANGKINESSNGQTNQSSNEQSKKSSNVKTKKSSNGQTTESSNGQTIESSNEQTDNPSNGHMPPNEQTTSDENQSPSKQNHTPEESNVVEHVSIAPIQTQPIEETVATSVEPSSIEPTTPANGRLGDELKRSDSIRELIKLSPVARRASVFEEVNREEGIRKQEEVHREDIRTVQEIRRELIPSGPNIKVDVRRRSSTIDYTPSTYIKEEEQKSRSHPGKKRESQKKKIQNFFKGSLRGKSNKMAKITDEKDIINNSLLFNSPQALLKVSSPEPKASEIDPPPSDETIIPEVRKDPSKLPPQRRSPQLQGGENFSLRKARLFSSLTEQMSPGSDRFTPVSQLSSPQQRPHSISNPSHVQAIVRKYSSPSKSADSSPVVNTRSPHNTPDYSTPVKRSNEISQDENFSAKQVRFNEAMEQISPEPSDNTPVESSTPMNALNIESQQDELSTINEGDRSYSSELLVTNSLSDNTLLKDLKRDSLTDDSFHNITLQPIRRISPQLVHSSPAKNVPSEPIVSERPPISPLKNIQTKESKLVSVGSQTQRFHPQYYELNQPTINASKPYQVPLKPVNLFYEGNPQTKDNKKETIPSDINKAKFLPLVSQKAEFEASKEPLTPKASISKVKYARVDNTNGSMIRSDVLRQSFSTPNKLVFVKREQLEGKPATNSASAMFEPAPPAVVTPPRGSHISIEDINRTFEKDYAFVMERKITESQKQMTPQKTVVNNPKVITLSRSSSFNGPMPSKINLDSEEMRSSITRTSSDASLSNPRVSELRRSFMQDNREVSRGQLQRPTNSILQLNHPVINISEPPVQPSPARPKVFSNVSSSAEVTPVDNRRKVSSEESEYEGIRTNSVKPSNANRSFKSSLNALLQRKQTSMKEKNQSKIAIPQAPIAQPDPSYSPAENIYSNDLHDSLGSSHEIRSIIQRNKRNSPKRVQFAKFVSVGVASPPPSEEYANMSERLVPPDLRVIPTTDSPPPPPPRMMTNEIVPQNPRIVQPEARIIPHQTSIVPNDMMNHNDPRVVPQQSRFEPAPPVVPRQNAYRNSYPQWPQQPDYEGDFASQALNLISNSSNETFVTTRNDETRYEGYENSELYTNTRNVSPRTSLFQKAKLSFFKGNKYSMNSDRYYDSKF